MTARERREFVVVAVVCTVLALALGLATPRTAHAPTQPVQEVTR